MARTVFKKYSEFAHAGQMASIADLTPGLLYFGTENVYARTRTWWLLIAVYVLMAAGVLGMMLSGTFLSIYGVVLGFPVSAAGLALPVMFPQYAQARLLTRGYTPGSKAWIKLAVAYTDSGTRLTAYLAALTYPVWALRFFAEDVIRIVRYVGALLKGEKIRFGSAEFLFYRKQAKMYNRIHLDQGREAAEDFLALTSIATDIPLKACITREEWDSKIRNEIMTYKEQKYGPMSDYGV